MSRNMGTGMCTFAMGDVFGRALEAAAESNDDSHTDFCGLSGEANSFREQAAGMHSRITHYAYPSPDQIELLDENPR